MKHNGEFTKLKFELSTNEVREEWKALLRRSDYEIQRLLLVSFLF